jgi:S-disulfanyl-L-cysteine oxidoreductase SoxD
MSKFLKSMIAVALLSSPLMISNASAGKLGLGRPATPDEVKAWDTDVRPDGKGLPEGRGNVEDGEELFIDNCAVCHGDFGEGVGRWPVLSGGHGSLKDARPVKTIGSYWPYASTLFDYIQRAMPFGSAQTLEPDEVYAITAYLLNMNDVVDEEFELSHENFGEIKLENEENFFMDDRADGELKEFSGEPCMEACKKSVEITKRAAIIDVTPGDGEEPAGGGID